MADFITRKWQHMNIFCSLAVEVAKYRRALTAQPLFSVWKKHIATLFARIVAGRWATFSRGATIQIDSDNILSRPAERSRQSCTDRDTGQLACLRRYDCHEFDNGICNVTENISSEIRQRISESESGIICCCYMCNNHNIVLCPSLLRCFHSQLLFTNK